MAERPHLRRTNDGTLVSSLKTPATPSSLQIPLRLRADQILSEVSATISEPFLELISGNPGEFFERLQLESGVQIEDKENNGQLLRIRGSFEQIVLAKIKLEKYLIDLQMSCFADQNDSQQHLPPDGDSNCMPFTAQNGNTILFRTKRAYHRTVTGTVKGTKQQPSSSVSTGTGSSKLKSKRKVGRPRKIAATTADVEMEVDLTGPPQLSPHQPEAPQPQEPQPEEYSSEMPLLSCGEAESNMVTNHEVNKPEETSVVSRNLEEEAERKAAEWLSVPVEEPSDCVLDNNDLEDLRKDDEMGAFEYSCELCSFKAEREGQFLKHVLIHGKGNPVHKCDRCEFASVSLNHFNRHKLSHSDSIFKCPQCPYQTDEAKQLARHVTVKHTMADNPPKRSSVLQCNECAYNTTKIYHFERHLLVHNRDLKGLLQVYHCDQCPYKTHRKEHFLRHRDNVHVRHRPYQCGMCSRSYKREDALQQHQVAVHNVYPQFSQLPKSAIDSLLDLALSSVGSSTAETTQSPSTIISSAALYAEQLNSPQPDTCAATSHASSLPHTTLSVVP